jgi:hypothetical protein
VARDRGPGGTRPLASFVSAIAGGHELHEIRSCSVQVGKKAGTTTSPAGTPASASPSATSATTPPSWD